MIGLKKNKAKKNKMMHVQEKAIKICHSFLMLPGFPFVIFWSLGVWNGVNVAQKDKILFFINKSWFNKASHVSNRHL